MGKFSHQTFHKGNCDLLGFVWQRANVSYDKSKSGSNTHACFSFCNYYTSMGTFHVSSQRTFQSRHRASINLHAAVPGKIQIKKRVHESIHPACDCWLLRNAARALSMSPLRIPSSSNTAHINKRISSARG